MKYAFLTTLVIALVAFMTPGKESKAEEGHAMKIRSLSVRPRFRRPWTTAPPAGTFFPCCR